MPGAQQSEFKSNQVLKQSCCNFAMRATITKHRKAHSAAAVGTPSTLLPTSAAQAFLPH